MYVLKTKLNDSSVEAFLDSVPDEKIRADSYQILDLMREITEEEPKMWGSSIIGFGSYRYKYASGQEGDWMLVGFSPRKQALSLYIMSGLNQAESLLSRLGKFSKGKGCLYIKKLEEIDLEVLKELVKLSVDKMKKSYKLPG